MSSELAQTAMLLALVAAAAASDVRERRVSNGLNLIIVAAGLGWRCAEGGWSPVLGIAGGMVGLGLLLVPFEARWIGGGDVKLMAALGLWLGPEDALWATLFGLAGGGLLSLAIGWTGGAAMRRHLAASVKTSLLTLRAPDAPRRHQRFVVPMAIPLGLAAVATFVVSRGVVQ